MQLQRRLPIGAEILPEGGAHFRVWAPRARRIDVCLQSPPQECFPLQAEEQGYFAGHVPSARPDGRYWLQLDSKSRFPDPASRFQPEGPLGPSQLIDPSSYVWNDGKWKGCSLPGQVIYEMHVGTFTPEGTWDSAREQLPALAELGITVIELMPIADFAGKFGWGYDGVNLFAPTRLYGTPDDLRRFVDEAHRLKLGVILDVVYNHFGPVGNFLPQFSSHYLTSRYDNDWGAAVNFDDPRAGPVREFAAANAAYWIEEFHLDGLRLDATQQIYDQSQEHIVTLIGREARRAAKGRRIILVAENEPQDARMIRPVEQGGMGLDGLWNDDFHHTSHVALTGKNEAYYSDYLGKPQELLSALKWGFLYQGQRYKWQKKRRGQPALDLSPHQFIVFLQNHDQVANSGLGHRVHLITSMPRYRAMTALLLLGPCTPMLFQGQEFAASSPFLFFADHEPELAQQVRQGRAKFLAQFPSLALPEVQAWLPDPADPSVFNRCKLDLSEREKHAGVYQLHRDLLALRRNDPAFSAQQPRGIDGAVLGEDALVLRYFTADGMDRLLLINLGTDLHFDPAPEPLLAPPAGKLWAMLWTSEDPRYGGLGTPPVDSDENWRIPGKAAVVLAPETGDSPE